MTFAEGKVGPAARRSAVLGLLGEFAREAAVLIAVFVPLDLVLIGALTGRAMAATVIGVTLLFATGVWLELRR